eukprot:3341084-Rhodomonas_salina.3
MFDGVRLSAPWIPGHRSQVLVEQMLPSCPEAADGASPADWLRVIYPRDGAVFRVDEHGALPLYWMVCTFSVSPLIAPEAKILAFAFW